MITHIEQLVISWVFKNFLVLYTKLNERKNAWETQ